MSQLSQNCVCHLQTRISTYHDSDSQSISILPGVAVLKEDERLVIFHQYPSSEAFGSHPAPSLKYMGVSISQVFGRCDFYSLTGGLHLALWDIK
jgi:hypothetical protein